MGVITKFYGLWPRRNVRPMSIVYVGGLGGLFLGM